MKMFAQKNLELITNLVTRTMYYKKKGICNYIIQLKQRHLKQEQRVT